MPPALTISTNSLAAEMGLAVITSLMRRTGPRALNLHLNVTSPPAPVDTAIVPASGPDEHARPLRSSMEVSAVTDTPAPPWASVVPAAAATTAARRRGDERA